jgi:hypothetical protein
MHGVNDVSDVRQREIHTAQPLVPEPSAFDVELAIEKLKIPKSPGVVQIAAELIKAGVEQFDMRSIILLFLFGLRKGDKTDFSNYRSISLLPAMYNILSNNRLSRLTPYAAEIIGDHQCGF